MRHITQQENTFLLSTAHTAMLLQITKYGHVELLHYGMPVSIEDAAALAARRTMPYGYRFVQRSAGPLPADLRFRGAIHGFQAS